MKTYVTPDKGIYTVRDEGDGIVVQGGSTITKTGFAPYKLNRTTVGTSQDITANDSGMVYCSSSTGAVITGSLAASSTTEGCMFLFKNANAEVGQFHVITASGETAGIPGIIDSGSNRGSNLVYSGSVTLISDGAGYIILGASGSFGLSGT